MGKLFEYAKKQDTLHKAWRRIRSNGIRAKASETREAIEDFERTARRDIIRIQKRLKERSFEFEPQKGVLIAKKSGGKRGIVMASVHNRIVERALLDTLQEKSPFIRLVNDQVTSFGGVPHRSVPHALKFLHDAFEGGYSFYVRSDISGFFDHIPRGDVLTKISEDIKDQDFMELLNAATSVTLSNEQVLGEDRSVFPTTEEGVAQGSPLSPLFGNILLHEFDQRFNERNILCARFIDDFVILGKSEKHVHKAFQNASDHLRAIELGCHDPFANAVSAEKASYGTVQSGFVFLGYDCRPGLFQPSLKARQGIQETIDAHLAAGRRSIDRVRRENNSFSARQRYSQTLTLIDRVLKGWGESFAYGNSASTIDDLDVQIDQKLNVFRQWFARKLTAADWKTKRRMGGVCLLGDIQPKSFDEVPFMIANDQGMRVTARTLTISTDGALAPIGRQKKGDTGPGGWAFVVHGTEEAHAGSALQTTNNRMELQAIIEAMRYADPRKSLRIRTDSRYVEQTYNKEHPVRKNHDLWEEFQQIKGSRKLRIVYVKGHSGDPENERADKLASQQAQEARLEAERNLVPDPVP